MVMSKSLTLAQSSLSHEKQMPIFAEIKNIASLKSFRIKFFKGNLNKNKKYSLNISQMLQN